MKISQKIEKALAEDRCFWSFEYFPPKTESGVTNLFDRMERMYYLGPEFVDVTWGAGGSTADLTIQICQTAQSVYGLETSMHLTCTNMPKEKIDVALEEAQKAGIQNILALRGDPPRGQENWTKVENGFAYAVDLVRYIREKYGDYFCISVAGYPEGHLDNPSREADLKHLKEKVDAGADYIVTQLFYDVDLYLEWVQKCRDIGITVPIIPGIMPIQSYGGFKRMTTLCKTFVPQFIHDELEPLKDDDQAVKDYGVSLAVRMCNQLREHGVRGFHFYTLNLEKSVRLILEGLDFVAPLDVVKPLPWQPSLAKNREKENVRPIFWRNRVRSYILRTEAWDDFPNGRWGDSRSPAFGEIDGYGATLKYTSTECLGSWGTPESFEQLFDVFVKYIKNQVPFLPWSDSPLSLESNVIRDHLCDLNSRGYLTINSQPAVDGIPSNDTVFGWGPKDGYVYQKAYLEFFVSPAALDKLLDRIHKMGNMTYFAVNKNGDLKTNSETEGANAVTWGVFPSREIVQPTVVECQSFLAWKDEAFSLWDEWAKLYSEGVTSSLLRTVANEWFLVNIVDNDYKRPLGIFEVFNGIRSFAGASLN